MLRIDAKGLPTVRLGDPQQLRVGDPVITIGSPFGFEQTAACGHRQCQGRSLPGDSAVPFIQTDAAGEPGQLRRPAVRRAGRRRRHQLAIYSRSPAGYQGPVVRDPDQRRPEVKDQIVATGKAQHARLGVTIQDLSRWRSRSAWSAPTARLVASVGADTAAAKAGLKPGDVVLGSAASRSGARRAVQPHRPGDAGRDGPLRSGATGGGVVDVKARRCGGGHKVAATANTESSPGQLGPALPPLTSEEAPRPKIEQAW